MNCVTWFEAFAFCTWDGGFLPTETEWNFAAAGGSAQRAYPWSAPADTLTASCANANYDVNGLPTGYCAADSGSAAAMKRVGAESPAGDGAWGHADLGGNAWEWTLDWFAAYAASCDDCANLQTGTYRVIRGGNFAHSQSFMRTASRQFADSDALPANRSLNVGFRCARPAS